MLDGMETLPGAAAAGERLKRTALRDFGPPNQATRSEKSYRRTIHPHEAPLPSLFKYALTLIGLEAHGPGEKVAWWVDFTYKGEWCELADEKFGLRIYLRTEAPEEEANKMLAEITKKLRSSMRTVEKVILEAAPHMLARGDATVVNQYRSLRRAYEYFRERAVEPVPIEDEYTHYEPPEGSPIAAASTFRSGKIQMRLNAFHDMIAAISAYLSLVEHVLVLSLAFKGFDPDKDNLTSIIGSRWGEKWERVLGKHEKSSQFRRKLTDVVERWRNPYSHGGFEKGNGATLWLHTPGVGAVPVGMTSVRDSPHFSFLPATETDITEVFQLLDEIDGWLEVELADAMRWIHSGLEVRFDANFRAEVAEAQKLNEFRGFLEYHEEQRAIIDNMDY